ncbi:MAG: hypothetical protein ACOYXY_02685, partial [Thermodesulfobacteriota bacterium]
MITLSLRHTGMVLIGILFLIAALPAHGDEARKEDGVQKRPIKINQEFRYEQTPSFAQRMLEELKRAFSAERSDVADGLDLL